jgi:hypothetical protein
MSMQHKDNAGNGCTNLARICKFQSREISMLKKFNRYAWTFCLGKNGFDPLQGLRAYIDRRRSLQGSPYRDSQARHAPTITPSALPSFMEYPSRIFSRER